MMSYADAVRAHGKTIVLGGARELFPVPESLTAAFAKQIQMTIRVAEEAAYREGVTDAQSAMRKAMGVE